jgi:nucleoside diphosphate kinase
MDDLQIDQTLGTGKLTLVVFTPDAIQGKLVGSIERWIREQTSCAPIAREWLSHTAETLDRFYPDVAARWPEPWKLISRVFMAGPCLATLWFGENASQVIPGVKGVTEPARCAASTVRGRFWCDNGVANLVHVSDDAGEVARELGVLRSFEPGLFSGRLSTQGLAPFPDVGPPAPRHSGILTLCSLVEALLSPEESDRPRLDVPDNEDARETMARAEAWLVQARARTSPAIAGAIESYLDGTADPSRFIRILRDCATVGPWEELMLRVGLLSRPHWLERR